MVVSLCRKSTPARRACAPAWWESVFTTSRSVLVRRVGLPESVPKVATPEMLTTGPTGSVGGASRSPWANWTRVSFTVRPESVQVSPRERE